MLAVMTTQRQRKPLDSAEAARRALLQLRPASTHTAATVHVRAGKEDAIVPKEAFQLLLDILGHMAVGNAVTVVPQQAEFTTQQAADYLNVSRPHLIALLEQGAIPFRKVGTHRRVRFADLAAHREADDARRRAILDELTADAQRHGMGY
jgi:excisionase family DNA binding protein